MTIFYLIVKLNSYRSKCVTDTSLYYRLRLASNQIGKVCFELAPAK